MRLKQLFLLCFAIVQHKAARTLANNNMLLPAAGLAKKLPGMRVQGASIFRLFNYSYCNYPHNQTKPKAAGITTKSSPPLSFSIHYLGYDRDSRVSSQSLCSLLAFVCALLACHVYLLTNFFHVLVVNFVVSVLCCAVQCWCLISLVEVMAKSPSCMLQKFCCSHRRPSKGEDSLPICSRTSVSFTKPNLLPGSDSFTSKESKVKWKELSQLQVK